MRKPRFFALTGSIGMGKSTTAQMFRDAGVPVHDADATVHELYAGEAAPLIEAAFPGTTIETGVDRAKLGEYVIGNAEAMKKLESIIHPLVRDRELAFRQTVDTPFAILDIPLLFETGGADRVDGIIVVTAPASMQRDRVLTRPGMTAEKFEAILARQTPDADKRAQADFIIDTGQGMEAARAAVLRLIDQLNSGWTRGDHHA
ncbi:MAG: dephospho-CoA kinase [Pseudomonadota bacterium]